MDGLLEGEGIGFCDASAWRDARQSEEAMVHSQGEKNRVLALTKARRWFGVGRHARDEVYEWHARVESEACVCRKCEAYSVVVVAKRKV